MNAMEVHRSGPHVKVIDVLRDDGAAIEVARPARYHVMSRVGPARGDDLASPGIPLPDEDRVAAECPWRRQVLGAELAPQSPASPERRHAAGGRDASPGQDRDPLRPPQPVGKELDLLIAHEFEDGTGGSPAIFWIKLPSNRWTCLKYFAYDRGS